MKKVLVLMLVLGLASLANASYLISFNGSGVTVSNDEALVGGIDMGIGIIGSLPMGEITYRTVGAPVSAPIITQYTGEEALGFGLPYDGGIALIMWGDPVTTANPAGDWFSMATPGLVLGTEANHTVQIDVTTNDGSQALSTIYLVPEPATMLILGLGGLLLRRK